MEEVFFCFHRKEEAVDSFQVNMDQVWSKETSWIFTGDIYQKGYIGLPIILDFSGPPKGVSLTNNRKQFRENIHILKSLGRWLLVIWQVIGDHLGEYRNIG